MSTSGSETRIRQPIPIEQLGSSNSLVLDYVHGAGRVGAYYAHRPTLESVERFARERARVPHRESLADILTLQQARWGIRPDPAHRFASGAVAVVTGQQAGLFTGPLLAVLKGLTAVKMARHLVSRGIDAVPVFWIASEDHDREEVSWADVVDTDAGLRRFEVELDGPPGAPVGTLRYPDPITSVVDGCIGALGKLEYASEIGEMLRSAYRPGKTPVDAFASMMGRLFSATEMIFLDPLDPAFRRLTEPVMARAFARSDAVREAVLERTARLEEAGYPAQVRVGDDFTGFFSVDDGVRRPLVPGQPAAGALSPNALLRPVIQDSVLPTAAYMAGPAEVAYFAQASAVYDVLDVAMPPALPRITSTVVEPPAARALSRYGLTLTDIFAGEDAVRGRVAGTEYDMDRFGDARTHVREALGALRPMLEGVDPTLGAALDTSLRKVTYQADRLERRFVRATTDRDAVRDRAIRNMLHRLAPHGKPQERALCPVGFLARYGLSLVSLLDRELSIDGAVHQVVDL